MDVKSTLTEWKSKASTNAVTLKHTASKSWIQMRETEPSDCVSGFHRKRGGCMAFMRRPSTYPFILLALVNLWLNADQNLIGPNLSQIADAFNLSEVQKDVVIGGQVNVAFIVVGAITTVLVGYLADRVCRRDLFVLIVMLGEFGCFCTIFVTNLAGFFVTRAVTGISIGGVSSFQTLSSNSYRTNKS